MLSHVIPSEMGINIKIVEKIKNLMAVLSGGSSTVAIVDID